ncbi:MAG: phosphate-starvation-inducible PsiE family protein [Magnetococcales bacterium]|nr:phosphate-starvation-inducible PsiE family protein [Magnetococcales bacterium]
MSNFFCRERLLPYFFNITNAVFGVILLFLTLGIAIGAGKLFLGLGTLLMSGTVTGSYQALIADVLSLFILIELSRSLVEYFELKRLRLVFIIDAAIVFVIREVMIKLFQDKMASLDIYAFSVLIIALGLIRTASVVVSPSMPPTKRSASSGKEKE